MLHRAGCLEPLGALGTLPVFGLAVGNIDDGEHTVQRQSWPVACHFPTLNLLHFSLLLSEAPSLHCLPS